jgi:hypothetical protein
MRLEDSIELVQCGTDRATRTFLSALFQRGDGQVKLEL